MKKLSLALVALLVLVFAMSMVVAEDAVSDSYEGGTNIITDDPDHKISYDNGKVTYTYNEGDVTDVKFDDKYINTVAGTGEATYSVDINPDENHWITINGKDYWIGKTEEPVITTAPTEEPPVTQKPVDPTKKPDVTRKPTDDDDDDDDDVPKTGDATIPTMVVLLMMAAAASVLVIRKSIRNR